MPATILAVDTATQNCSVALSIDNDIITLCENAPREHTIKILPMIDQVLAQASISLSKLDAIAFGQGPGSFTGVRIGTSVAQGLAFGANLPMIGISTLAAMAEQTYRLHGALHVISAIDARMNEIYLGVYSRMENGDWQSLQKEQVCDPSRLKLNMDHPFFMAGNGWEVYPFMHVMFDIELIKSEVRFPQAQDMLVLAKHAFLRNELVAPENASPVYLRDSVTWEKIAKKR